MSEKNERIKRAYWYIKEKGQQYSRTIGRPKVKNRRFKNKKHTLGRLKYATYLNNWNNVRPICQRGTMTMEEYKFYIKNK